MKSNQIKLVRTYDAPIKAVWDAWSDPKESAHWWGPRGFTITTQSKDLRPGGEWIYTMHSEGRDFINSTRYLEVKPGARLVYDHGASPESPPMFRVAVDFLEMGQKTKMDMTLSFATAELAERTQVYIKKAGGDSCWDRLAEYLQKKISGKEVFYIHRSFNAPIGRVYEAWSDPRLLAEWLAPTGSSMKFFEADIKTGGKAFYQMSNGKDYHLYGKTQYFELVKLSHIIYTQQFCDEHQKVIRHPMAPTWPESMHTTVRFIEEGPKQTQIAICWEPVAPCTPEEIAAFASARGGMTGGWTGSLDKLEAFFESKN